MISALMPAGGCIVSVACIAAMARPTARAANHGVSPSRCRTSTPASADRTWPPTTLRARANALPGADITRTIDVVKGASINGRLATPASAIISAMPSARRWRARICGRVSKRWAHPIIAFRARNPRQNERRFASRLSMALAGEAPVDQPASLLAICAMWRPWKRAPSSSTCEGRRLPSPSAIVDAP